MRLIDTETYKLVVGTKDESYAIVSHTWREIEEVTYAEFLTDKGKSKKGYTKIRHLCEQARKDGIKYAWIDTVCIDKSSSVELSEAINSMFRWYQNAEICYVFLDDASTVSEIPESRWITRGWTLQELLAPIHVSFYNKHWKFLGTKASMVQDLAQWTKIDQIALTDPRSIKYISAATRMFWAANRYTTREEDIAYCLLGIFDIHMPLLYGEGQRAFYRLQQEILRQTHDITILAFNRDFSTEPDSYLFAEQPVDFGQAADIISLQEPTQCEVTSRGVHISVRLIKSKIDLPSDYETQTYYAVLNCRFRCDLDGLLAIRVQQQAQGTDEMLFLPDVAPLTTVPWHLVQVLPPVMINIIDQRHKNSYRSGDVQRSVCQLRAETLLSQDFAVVYAGPQTDLQDWNPYSLIAETYVAVNNVLLRKFAFVRRSRNQAFIVQLAIFVEWTRTHIAFLSSMVKPQEVACESWLHEQSMFSATEQLSQPNSAWKSLFRDRRLQAGPLVHWPDGGPVMIDDTLWQIVRGKQKAGSGDAFTPILLAVPSDRSVDDIAVRIERQEFGLSSHPELMWTIFVTCFISSQD